MRVSETCSRDERTGCALNLSHQNVTQLNIRFEQKKMIRRLQRQPVL